MHSLESFVSVVIMTFAVYCPVVCVLHVTVHVTDNRTAC